VLAQGTDYTVAGTVVTIKKVYLAKQATGSTVLNFSFRGIGVDWITASAPDESDADIYLDGTLVRRVLLHGATAHREGVR
jgi:hypothetical protein